MTQETDLSYGSGQHAILENCYVAKEGNEVRRWPGWRLCVDPDYKTSPRPFTTWKATGVGTIQTDRRKLICGFEVVRGVIVIIGKDDPILGTDGVPILNDITFELDPPKTYPSYTKYRARFESLAAWIVNRRPSFASPPGFNNWGRPSSTYDDNWETENDTHFAEVANRHGQGLFPLWGIGDSTYGEVVSSGVAVASAPAGSFYSEVIFDRAHGVTADMVTQGIAMRFWDHASTPAAALNNWFTVITRVDALTLRVQDVGAGYLGGTGGGFEASWIRNERELLHRPTLDNAGDRLLLAIPGYGCIFQVPLLLEGTPTLYRSPSGDRRERFVTGQLRDRPRCLGVPKGIVNLDGVVVDQGAPIGDMATGTYHFRIAYRDTRTGEIGAASESVKVIQTVVNSGIDIGALLPAQAMCESLANEILVYGSVREADGGSPSVMGLVQVINLEEETPMTGVIHPTQVPNGVIFWSNTAAGANPIDFDQRPRLEAIEQMPRGAKAIKTMKAITFIGGVYGDIGLDRALQAMTLIKHSNITALIEDDKVQMDPAQYDGAMVAATSKTGDQKSSFDTDWIGGVRIPPAYVGAFLNSSELFYFEPTSGGYTRHRSIRLDRIKNIEAEDLVALPYILPNGVLAQEFGLQVVVPKDLGTRGIGYIRAKRGDFFHSEQAAPNAFPPFNRIHLDASEEEDIEAFGSFRDVLIGCTRSSTYALNWNRNPAGGQADLVDPTFGCIAANSMIEFEGGLAWISDRGPVMFRGGGVEWMGRPLYKDFAPGGDFLRDTKKLMSYIFGAHDPERGLLLWGVIDTTLPSAPSAPTSSAEDDVLSFAACNKVIAYSYMHDSWSIWIPPVGLESMWMRPIVFDDGIPRLSFLGEDGKIYGFDEGSSDNRKTAVDEVTRRALEFTNATEPGTATEVCLVTTGSIADPDDPLHPFVDTAVGMEWFLTDATGNTFKDNGTVTGRRQANLGGTDYDCLDLGKIVTHLVGDVIHVGSITMKIETMLENFGSDLETGAVQGVIFRYRLFGNDVSSQSNALTGRPLSFAQVKLQTFDDQNVIVGPKRLGVLSPTTHAAALNFETRVSMPEARVAAHSIRATITIFAGQQVRLDQVTLLRPSSGSQKGS